MTVFVAIGTIAELIKLMPVILALRSAGVKVRGIATGQNDLAASDLFELVFPNGLEALVVQRPTASTALAFARWAFACFMRAPFVFRKCFRRHGVRRPCLLVHGDTVSTLIGGIAGCLAGAEVVHVEAGLRSFNFLRPFPEEINRVLVSRFATWAFCPGEWAVQNLKATRIPHVVDTHENTLVDAMRIALTRPCTPKLAATLPKHYFVFVCHRQENLFDAEFLQQILNRVERAAESLPCVAVLHEPAAAVFAKLGLLSRLERNPQIVAVPRLGYVDFTHMLRGATFIVTDGGSNQEESYYLGKPCLLLRKETERQEGLGENAVLGRNDPKVIEAFFRDPQAWQREPQPHRTSPSQLIADALRSV
jgi:UDP-N-acetylglucosamine 2-epimerase (non-hydrolysing)